jgi:hypothetical protein
MNGIENEGFYTQPSRHSGSESNGWQEVYSLLVEVNDYFRAKGF